MKRNYRRITLDDRKRMEKLYNQEGLTVMAIAKALEAHPATVYRELQRGKKGHFYIAVLAHENLKRGKQYTK